MFYSNTHSQSHSLSSDFGLLRNPSNPISLLAQFKLHTQFFLTGTELSNQDLSNLLSAAQVLKDYRFDLGLNVLHDQSWALIFEKPSLRTRLSFTIGIQELGGRVVELTSSQTKNEEPEDAIRVLQGMVHGVMIRTFEHSHLEKMKKFSKIPIINGLSDSHHPCQALADLLTLKQDYKKIEGLTVSYIGDGNNILHSTLLLFALAGVNVNYSCPAKFGPDKKILAQAIRIAKSNGVKIKKFVSPKLAVKGTHAIMTDVWTSMGSEDKADSRKKEFKGYQLNKNLYDSAGTEPIIMHCLPMNKGEEITAEMVEHKKSRLFQQAENRLHVQKALLFGMANGNQCLINN